MQETINGNYVYVREEIVGVNYDYYLPYEIEEIDSVVEVCQRLRTMTEHDTMTIHIVSCGGLLDTALAIRAAIDDCKGSVVGSIEGRCASAATIVFLSCSAFRVGEFGSMMIHAPSWGYGGKHNEVGDHFMFNHSHLEHVMREVYKNFLTEEEIANILAARDAYLDREEILKRLHHMVEINSNEEDKDNGEPERT